MAAGRKKAAGKSAASGSGLARNLAEFVARTDGAAIPPELRRRAVHHILDATGIAFAASQLDFATIALDGLAPLSGAGNVPVLGHKLRWSPRDAAIVNGLLCHGLDFDDTHLQGIVHPTVTQFPAALSAAVAAETNIADMITAFILGSEAAVRISSAAAGGFHKKGFHPTGICNAMAAALTCGRLFGLDKDQLCHAQGIALSMASGTLEFISDGAWTKRLHPGWAAFAGLTAASMARAGYIGASAPYSGRFGLFRAFQSDDADWDPDVVTERLGEQWQSHGTAIKPYPACHLTHGCIDAAIALNRKANGAPGKIETVTALVARDMVPSICEPAAAKKRPRTGYEAQFSIPYLVATALLKGRVSLADLEPEALSDAQTLALADRVAYEIDPGSGYPRHYSGEIRILMADGTAYSERRQINSGAPDMPVSDREIVEKFRANAATTLEQASVARLLDIVLSAADSEDTAAGWADRLAAIS